MLDKERARKMVSKGTHAQLTKLLYELDHIKDDKNAVKTKTAKMQKVRRIITNLFTYKETFELHDSHILELAEIVEGIYPELPDLEGYTEYILKYLTSRIAKYEKLSREYTRQLRYKKRDKLTDPDGYLDLKYIAWTYTRGYHHQTYYSYLIMKAALEDLLIFKRDGVICGKKTSGKASS